MRDRKLYVSWMEFKTIKTWSEQLEKGEISHLQYYKKIRSLLGKFRTPKPFSGIYDLVILESQYP